MSPDIVQWLEDWQTLVGAVLGAAGALMVALVVSRAQERRERRTAASVLNIDLVMTAGAVASLERQFPNVEKDAEHVREWAVRLLRSPPALSALFDSDALLHSLLF